ncbi:FapA family protein [Anoxybacillus sp. LAT_35]|uniref:FapA family protein n=1 Tax=Anoxybacillus TaxID=150247 RepID=UPI001EDB58E1|nr:MULTISPECIES: FapA family protein [Anoxybacillus]MCG5026397.1 FapA family protein [Anoxybacillus flavithermus]MCG6196734.1 FapA family protein [Anoxybacillus sp. LAT_38]MCG3083130.1 FapA family protein [Anoxybacillus sp. LAT27]MCG3084396.1 FapA family protein [Anoxybacillus sp. LAT27]MCG6171063.1 FapA family protein [Anoxybacillus sp. LAT_11]
MDCIEVKGKTVEEAIGEGLKQLQATREEVIIEVVQQERKKLFGVVSQPAVVRLTKKQQANQMIQQVEGKAWIQDGTLYYECLDVSPTIVIGEGVICLHNGQQVEGSITLQEGDDVRIYPKEESIAQSVWRIDVDARKLEATLTFAPGVRRRYILEDQSPSNKLHIQAKIETELIYDVSYEKVIAKLQELGIVYGIREEVIREVLQSEKKITAIIARGIEPTEGKDGWVEVKVGEGKRTPKVREDGTVDYREIEMIATVGEGDLIAIVHPPLPGKPGLTITNDVIPVREVHPVMIKLGKGVTMDGNRILATTGGRPQIAKKGKTVVVSILPKLVHQGDVDLSVGNIHFKGDVEITGNVQDEMVVEALGSIMILQNVNRAKIRAQQSIFIQQNVISGTVTSGENKMIVTKLIGLLQQIRHSLERMIVAIQQLMVMSKIREQDIYPLTKRLLESKFQTTMEAMKQYKTMCEQKREQIGEQWFDIGSQLDGCLLADRPNHFHCLEGMANLLRELNTFIGQYDREENDAIELSYALNSVIHGSGDVVVTGKGCYNCNIYAGGTLTVHGVLRGGEAYAQKGMKIKEVGSSLGIKTVLAVPKGETIYIEHAWEGTVVQFGKKTYTFYEEKKHVEMKWDDERQEIVFG